MSHRQNVQYRTDANLAFRRSIYAYQRPRLHLPSRVLGLAALSGQETMADIGCGPARLGERLRLDHGAELLATEFHSVTRHVSGVGGGRAGL